ncbi:hypothetical protein, partial [Neisseria meningitidis]|uniref:hypothetical protein n=1 Tax=Neisseria meningitidis TaxID=487 RepID=UPI001F250BA6
FILLRAEGHTEHTVNNTLFIFRINHLFYLFLINRHFLIFPFKLTNPAFFKAFLPGGRIVIKHLHPVRQNDFLIGLSATMRAVRVLPLPECSPPPLSNLPL